MLYSKQGAFKNNFCKRQNSGTLKLVIALLIVGLVVVVALSDAYLSSVSPSTRSIAITRDQTNSQTTSETVTYTNSTSLQPTADYLFFIEPNLARINLIREWFMSPFNLAAAKPGYDPTYGMIRGGYWAGVFQDGYVLIDSELIVAKTLDYLNAENGVSTNIEANLANWLSNTTFVNPSNGQTSNYSGNDRREIMFGNLEQCVMEDSGQVYYAPGHMLNDPVPITTALPTQCASDGSQSMNIYSMQIELTYLQGNTGLAEQMFQNTLAGWTPTNGTGLGGTTGGYFSNVFDEGNCKSSRALAYWIEMARATGFWSLNSDTKTIAQEVMNELWAHQLPSGGISVNYPSCGNDNKDSVESSGLTLVAFDPRVPQWFNQGQQPTNTSGAPGTASQSQTS